MLWFWCSLQDSDGSIGELSEGQRPRLTRAQERMLMGNSIFMKHASAQSSGSRPRLGLRSASPGQLARIGGTIAFLFLFSDSHVDSEDFP